MVLAQEEQEDLGILKAFLNDKKGLTGRELKIIEKLPLDRFIILNDLIYHQSVNERDRKTALQLFIPTRFVNETLEFGHVTLAGHGGVAKTFMR